MEDINNHFERWPFNRWCLGTSLMGTLIFLTQANAPDNGWKKFQSYQKPRRIMPQYKRNVPG
jgi:hypothetical protein